MPTKYLTVAEVADILRLSPWRVTQICRDGKIPATKPTGTWLISEEDLQRHIEAASNQRAAS